VTPVHRRGTLVLLAVAAVSLAACSSGTTTTATTGAPTAHRPTADGAISGTTGPVTGPFGPAWGRFTAAFPSAPDVATDLDAELGRATGAQAASGYAVSGNHNLFRDESIERSIPTYEVVVILFGTAAQASAYVAKQPLTDPVAVSAGGATGFRVLTDTPATPASASGQPAVPAAAVGVQALVKGNVAYLAFVATAPIGADPSPGAFLASVAPAP